MVIVALAAVAVVVPNSPPAAGALVVVLPNNELPVVVFAVCPNKEEPDEGAEFAAACPPNRFDDC